MAERYRQPQSTWPAAHVVEKAVYTPLAALSEPPPFPEDNAYSEAKWLLGKHLFFERRLSRSGQIACASCHDPDLGWADGRTKAIGHNRQQGDLNSPRVVNSAWLSELFWNGRAKSLEQQVVESWENPIGMAADARLQTQEINTLKGYRLLIKKAFSTATLTHDQIAMAIATFMRTLTLSNTRFDRFMRGERNILSPQEIKGLHLFRTKARCINYPD